MLLVIKNASFSLTPKGKIKLIFLLFIFSDEEESKISTIVVRGSTEGLMDDLERALNDGINTFKALTKDGRLLPGAGATEIELAKQLTSYGEVGGREK